MSTDGECHETVSPSTIGKYLRVALVLMVLGWMLEMVKVIAWWR